MRVEGRKNGLSITEKFKLKDCWSLSCPAGISISYHSSVLELQPTSSQFGEEPCFRSRVMRCIMIDERAENIKHPTS